MEFLEQKNIMTFLKGTELTREHNAYDRERINDFENKEIEMTQFEQEGENRKEMTRTSETCGTTDLTFVQSQPQKKKEKSEAQNT